MKQNNYHSLVIAGLGGVGRGLLTVGKAWFSSFASVIGVDSNEVACRDAERCGICVQRADIGDEAFLDEFSQSLPEPVLFVNCCSGIDTVKLRRYIQDKPVAYIDICESEMVDNPQNRFSVGMPYTNQRCHGDYPHWLCQGINPGLVEYIARRLMRQMHAANTGFSVAIFENDQLSAEYHNGKLAVGWCPKDLIEEIMICPSLVYEDGDMIDRDDIEKNRFTTCWQGVDTPTRLVGHEDVWNLAQREEVSDVKFLYALHPEVMAVFEETPEIAMQKLQLPQAAQTLHGLERIIVSVEHAESGRQKSLLWQSDHALTQRCLGINAVQYQTASSVLLSILMMQHTPLGRKAGTWNGSTLPLEDEGWKQMEQFMQKLGIFWQPVPGKYVCGCEEGRVYRP